MVINSVVAILLSISLGKLGEVLEIDERRENSEG